MKRDFHITDTKHGRRLMMLEPEKTQALVEAGQTCHVTGNMYRTKVMVADLHPVRADAAESCVGQKLAAGEPVLPINGEPKPDAFKRGRGRPKLKK